MAPKDKEIAIGSAQNAVAYCIATIYWTSSIMNKRLRIPQIGVSSIVVTRNVVWCLIAIRIFSKVVFQVLLSLSVACNASNCQLLQFYVLQYIVTGELNFIAR